MTHDPDFRRLFVNRLWTTILAATDRQIPAVDRDRARRFLTSGAGFATACVRAGLDPDRVRHHSLNLIGQDATQRAAPAICTPAQRRSQPRRARSAGRPIGSARRRLEHNGRSQTIEAWADELGMNHKTIRSRLSLGWTVDRTLTQPALPRRRPDRGVGRAENKNAGTGVPPTAQIST